MLSRERSVACRFTVGHHDAGLVSGIELDGLKSQVHVREWLGIFLFLAFQNQAFFGLLQAQKRLRTTDNNQ